MTSRMGALQCTVWVLPSRCRLVLVVSRATKSCVDTKETSQMLMLPSSCGDSESALNAVNDLARAGTKNLDDDSLHRLFRLLWRQVLAEDARWAVIWGPGGGSPLTH